MSKTTETVLKSKIEAIRNAILKPSARQGGKDSCIIDTICVEENGNIWCYSLDDSFALGSPFKAQLKYIDKQKGDYILIYGTVQNDCLPNHITTSQASPYCLKFTVTEARYFQKKKVSSHTSLLIHQLTCRFKNAPIFRKLRPEPSLKKII